MQADGVAALRARLGEHAYWIAGSTREGEEVRLLTALKSHPLRTHLRALIVPRHPQRFDEVYTLAQSLGFRVGRRSTMQPHDSVEVVIGDSMGEMFAYYGVARVAFMGGSLATGSQNLIEPCAVGIPVVLGPSIFNFEAAAQAALAHGAAVQVADETQALDELLRIATQPQEQARMATQATAFCAANRGAIEKTWRFLVQSTASHDDAK
jgi:3-deoxy-D-manno-octulosonic-acid transferase